MFAINHATVHLFRRSDAVKVSILQLLVSALAISTCAAMRTPARVARNSYMYINSSMVIRTDVSIDSGSVVTGRCRLHFAAADIRRSEELQLI